MSFASALLIFSFPVFSADPAPAAEAPKMAEAKSTAAVPKPEATAEAVKMDPAAEAPVSKAAEKKFSKRKVTYGGLSLLTGATVVSGMDSSNGPNNPNNPYSLGRANALGGASPLPPPPLPPHLQQNGGK